MVGGGEVPQTPFNFEAKKEKKRKDNARTMCTGVNTSPLTQN